MDFASRLSKALAHSKKKRKALAAALGVSVQAIGQVLNGDTKAMSADNCARAARFLGIDGYWLATGDGDMTDGEEAELLAFFRQLNEKGREHVLASARGMAAQEAMLRDDAAVKQSPKAA